MNDRRHHPVTCPNDGCDLSGVLNFELNEGVDFCPMCKSVLVAFDKRGMSESPAGEENKIDPAGSTPAIKYTVH